jgi:RHS repeat-associated protein
MNGTCASGTVLETTSFVYDGDGNMVKKIKPDGSKTIYVGGIYEVDKTSGGSVTRTVTYYPVAGAMRINSTLYYVLKDHLGSASVVTDASGVTVGEQRYYPYGETRLTTGTIYTDKLFTGQREITGLGIYHYGARFFSPKLGRFLSPDSIVPGAANPQAWNRYSYGLNNPSRYTDPSGHMAVGDTNEGGCNTPGSPMCIIDRYGYNSSEMDRELENYHRAYSSYDPSTDPLLEGTNRVIVAAAFSRVGCASGSNWDCAALGMIAGLGMPGPTGTGGFLTPINNSSVPANLINDVYPQPAFDAEGRLPNIEVRSWYIQQLKQIDTNGPRTEEFARQIVAERNALKLQARDLMVNRAEAALLDSTRPIESFEYYVQKYSAQGYSGEDLWDRIIIGGTTPNPAVNAKYHVR